MKRLAHCLAFVLAVAACFEQQSFPVSNSFMTISSSEARITGTRLRAAIRCLIREVILPRLSAQLSIRKIGSFHPRSDLGMGGWGKGSRFEAPCPGPAQLCRTWQFGQQSLAAAANSPYNFSTLEELE
jgi:hypothetical protein